ncbi:tetratricopeptide repeat protein [Virgibacillus sp. SK37]|uniref:tetratricopeptide repeat protein n=1 Tax=Virgibacillus sp. SK37 TaxID=403957 RepID=UPI0004D1194F|nr:hypothetical protein [Virgibacillus sp. SK37]AIF45552.1 hypothetical protein X953_16295 [Virgibacillus sp. SK37]
MNNEVEHFITEGVRLKRAGDLEGALNCYLQAVDLNPTNMKVFISLAKTAHLLKRQNLAARCYLSATHLMLEPIEKVIDSPEKLPDYLRMAYGEFLEEQLQQLPRKSAFAILLDSNTPRHTAHTMIDLSPDILENRSDLKPFSEIYRASILGDGSYGSILNQYGYTSDDQMKVEKEIYIPAGQKFLMTDLKWDQIESQDVIDIYF